MKRLIFLFIAVVTIVSCSIEEDYNTFNVTNNSSEEIYIAFDFDNSVISSFEDSSLESSRIIQSMSSNLFSVDESVFSGNKELTLIIITKDVYDTNSWQDIVNDNLFDERYDLTLSELREINNEIVYN
ncbi:MULTISPECIES: hypothetical protein [Nonlabens]|uniref:Uncharacterized protein n=2 Tax=Nonlabens ulvanivorans TaxID=906888 RepID=A0A084JXX1_NONUL|nr:hypothetical protein [Nonlabens ulvanivorans]KEZ93805.1 hypothetical protein IL45_06300 [Nonlabens ulvanivorans]PRX14409.1 hypothetical protein LY02_01439 [Nonlabens ulvanivorans]GAK77471.1 hypothetical protein JCM19296_3079 [Nonlabens ulvanivorans]